MKVIIDTNVLMSGIFWAGPPYQILSAWQNKIFDLILSTDILEEYIRVANILSKKYPKIEIEEIIDLIVTKSKIYNVPSLLAPVSRDQDDDKFIACAVFSKTKIIVSGDIHLLEVSGYQSIEVIKPRVFLDNYLGEKK